MLPDMTTRSADPAVDQQKRQMTALSELSIDIDALKTLIDDRAATAAIGFEPRANQLRMKLHALSLSLSQYEGQRTHALGLLDTIQQSHDTESSHLNQELSQLIDDLHDKVEQLQGATVAFLSTARRAGLSISVADQEEFDKALALNHGGLKDVPDATEKPSEPILPELRDPWYMWLLAALCAITFGIPTGIGIVSTLGIARPIQLTQYDAPPLAVGFIAIAPLLVFLVGRFLVHPACQGQKELEIDQGDASHANLMVKGAIVATLVSMAFDGFGAFRILYDLSLRQHRDGNINVFPILMIALILACAFGLTYNLIEAGLAFASTKKRLAIWRRYQRELEEWRANESERREALDHNQKVTRKVMDQIAESKTLGQLVADMVALAEKQAAVEAMNTRRTEIDTRLRQIDAPLLSSDQIEHLIGLRQEAVQQFEEFQTEFKGG